MERYIWLFPIIFIFHDMEEIIGFGIWLKRNRKMLDERFPSISRTYSNFSTEGMAVAVFEELIVCILICGLALLIHNKYMYHVWLGALIACTLHFFIHIIQAIVIRQYIPATATSIICLPFSIWIIRNCIFLLHADLLTTLQFSVVGILLVAGNLKFAQSLIGRFTQKVLLNA